MRTKGNPGAAAGAGGSRGEGGRSSSPTSLGQEQVHLHPNSSALGEPYVQLIEPNPLGTEDARPHAPSVPPWGPTARFTLFCWTWLCTKFREGCGRAVGTDKRPGRREGTRG